MRSKQHCPPASHWIQKPKVKFVPLYVRDSVSFKFCILNQLKTWIKRNENIHKHVLLLYCCELKLFPNLTRYIINILVLVICVHVLVRLTLDETNRSAQLWDAKDWTFILSCWHQEKIIKSYDCLHISQFYVNEMAQQHAVFSSTLNVTLDLLKSIWQRIALSRAFRLCTAGEKMYDGSSLQHLRGIFHPKINVGHFTFYKTLMLPSKSCLLVEWKLLVISPHSRFQLL